MGFRNSSGSDQEYNCGELTFYTCYDETSEVKTLKIDEENLWNTSLEEREKLLKAAIKKSPLKSCVDLTGSDDETLSLNGEDFESEDVFIDSPLPLRERIANESRGRNILNNCKNLQESQRSTIQSPATGSTKADNKENFQSTLGKEAIAESLNPLRNSTQLGKSEKGKQSHREPRNKERPTGHRKITRSSSSTDEAEADVALEDLFRSVRTPSSKSTFISDRSEKKPERSKTTKKESTKSEATHKRSDIDESLSDLLNKVQISTSDGDTKTTSKVKTPRAKTATKTPLSVRSKGRCWFLNEDSIEPQDFTPYIEDFHLLSNRQLLLNREKQTRMLFTVLNKAVFNAMFNSEEFKLEWNKNLTSTAGRTNCVSTKTVKKRPDGTQDVKIVGRFATIELASKILDSADRLRDTLVHEMCHAAVWVETGDRSAGHGPLWQKWGKRVHLTFPSLPLATRCHNYAINYKFYYQCTQCDNKIGRFSKSINMDKQVCGRCHGRFKLMNKNLMPLMN